MGRIKAVMKRVIFSDDTAIWHGYIKTPVSVTSTKGYQDKDLAAIILRAWMRDHGYDAPTSLPEETVDLRKKTKKPVD